MKRIFLLLIMLAIASTIGSAQTITRTLAWDKSADDTRDPAAANPVKYRVYKCTDQALTACTSADVGTELQKSVTLINGVLFFFVRARWFEIDVNDVPTGAEVESGNSNVLKIQVHIPPGNPGNARIDQTTVAQSRSGQIMRLPHNE